MRWDLLIAVFVLFIMCVDAYSQDKPVAYQPDIVGQGRMFLVVLNVPVNTPELSVKVPSEIEMFDRTPLPTTKTQRKYYFRALEPTEKTEIVFGHPAGPVTIPITIWSFDDLREYRELKGVQLPRRWPLHEELPELKQGQTVTTEAMKERAKGTGNSGSKWVALSDDEVWNMQPDSTIPRWHWVQIKHGCPVHGTEIYETGAYYPWLEPEGPSNRTYGSAVVPYNWKLMCPVGKEIYPSNDFANGDMTSGEFPDDGIGGGILIDGVHYGIIAERAQSYCHEMLRVAPDCAQGYLQTGDVAYLHKTLVALSRLAVEYAYLATMTQHRHRNSQGQVDRIGPGRFDEGPFLSGTGFTIYCIDQPGYQMNIADAYDKIWPDIEKDEQIIPYLQDKGFDVNTYEDVRRFIEENLMAVWMQGAMDGATASNEPFSQMGLARMAEVLNYERGNEFMDWLYNGPGKMRYFVPNTFFRDGSPYESTGGYNGMHVTAVGPIVESVEHLREMRPELYPNEKYPDFTQSRRYHAIFDFAMDTVNIDRTFPRVGDGGAQPEYKVLGRMYWQNGGTAAFEHAYRIFKDPKFAWVLIKSGWRPPEGYPYTYDEVKADAGKWSDDWNDASSLKDGYGLAMLRSGQNDNKRSLWMMYGRARGHVHDDMLHMGLDAYKGEILGHMGYPRNWNYWEGAWQTQNNARQIPYVNMTANAQLFVDAGPVHVAESYAQAFSDQVANRKSYVLDENNWQRRMLGIIDVSDEEFYCIDFHRVAGGKDRWYALHCQEGDFTTEGLDLVKQEGGTLAGPDVPYGDPTWLKANGCSESIYGFRGPNFAFAHLYDVERDSAPAGPWSADWALKNADGLHFRTTVTSAEGCEVVISNGKSPAGASPYEMKFVMLHSDDAEDSVTQVASVMEVYRNKRFIQSIEPLEVTGADEAGLNAYGCIVKLADGRTDYIFASADGSVVRTAVGGFEFAGRFGLYSERNGKPERIALIGGTTLTRNGIGVSMDAADYKAEIAEVDRENETVTVKPAPADPEALVGRYVFITNEYRRLAYKVIGAEAIEDGAKLQLEYDSLVGTGEVSTVEADVVRSSTPFQLRGYRYYHGARLVNAAGDAEYRIDGINGGAFIDMEKHPGVTQETLQAQFPTGSWFNVYDYGAGDTLEAPSVASVELRGQQTYAVTTTGNVALSVPKDAGSARQ